MVCKQSSLFTLAPFLDEEGVIRVKGRLGEDNDLTYEENHPIIVPKGYVSFLLVKSQHENLKHVGVGTPISSLRSRYWIISVRSIAKRVVKQCVSCRRYDAKLMDQVTAPLPQDRVTRAPPFSVTGTDHAGPLYCSDTGEKTALHLELGLITRSINHICLLEDSSHDPLMENISHQSQQHSPSHAHTSNDSEPPSSDQREEIPSHEVPKQTRPKIDAIVTRPYGISTAPKKLPFLFVTYKDFHDKENTVRLFSLQVRILSAMPGINNSILSTTGINNSTLSTRVISNNILSTRDINNSILSTRGINNCILSTRGSSATTFSPPGTSTTAFSPPGVSTAVLSPPGTSKTAFSPPESSTTVLSPSGTLTTALYLSGTLTIALSPPGTLTTALSPDINNSTLPTRDINNSTLSISDIRNINNSTL
ncbi:pro-pol polyprotein [Plakobranchus ocellatus]|uniref:Pro-pol polyprotein n=1 Tax=Plakobranchus ocellatus TaxID=259542 RepID=A0AAV3ZHP7_9GAST|nr:pro-pol polyprotein [Plakobranchus ocellatus]